MNWKPNHQGWNTFINFELRYGEVLNVREIYENYIRCHPGLDSWIKYATFEMKQGKENKVRGVYERAIKEIEIDARSESLVISFAQFETLCHEHVRARLIYKYALNLIPRSLSQNIFDNYMAFEKQYG